MLVLTVAQAMPLFGQKAGRQAEAALGPSPWDADERLLYPGTRIFYFYCPVRDFSAGALRMVLNYQNAPSQKEICRAMLLKPEQDPQGLERLWQAWVLAFKDAYQPRA